MATIDLGDTNLYYVEKGAGAPVVFVHGSLSDARTWGGQVESFAHEYRAIAYSRRHHWPNPPIDPDLDGYDMSVHLADLRRVVSTLGATPAHLVGNSYGAVLCLMLAIRHPELVRSLTLGEPPVISLFLSRRPTASEVFGMLLRAPSTGWSVLRFGVVGVGRTQKLFARGEPEAAMRAFLCAVLGSVGANPAPDLVERYRDNLGAFEAEMAGPGFLPISRAEVRRVGAPTLLVTGQRSPAFLRKLTRQLERLLPDAETTVLAGASHIAHEDAPAAHHRAVSAFLARHSGSRDANLNAHAG